MTRLGKIRSLICQQDCQEKCNRFLTSEIDFNNPAESCPRSWASKWDATTPGSAVVVVAPNPFTKIDKEQLMEAGRRAWRWLHENASTDSLTMERLAGEFLPMIPAYGCQCKREWQEILQKNPLPNTDQFIWSWNVHNIVNAKLSPPKSQISLEEAIAIYGGSATGRGKGLAAGR